MNDSTPTACTCPSGDGSLRHPCPTHVIQRAPAQPAAAQEAVALYYVANVERGGDFNYIPISMFDQPAIFATEVKAQAFCDFANGAGSKHEVRALAAPVAVAPVDLHAAGLLHVLGATDFVDASRIVGNMLAQASTPAAPGIDLDGLRKFIDELDAEVNSASTSDNVLCQKSAGIKRRVITRLLALIDASPKASENMRDWSLRMAKLEEGQHVGAGAHGLKDSPKGGGVAITDSDRIDLIAGEFLHIEPVEIRASEDDADVGWVISQRHMRKGLVELARWDNDNLRPAIDAAMQAISAEVGA